MIKENTFNFENLMVYQKSLVFIDRVYALTETFPAIERFNLSDQFRRAATSIALNIGEGSGSTDKEFNQFLRISKRSLKECVVCTTLSKKRNYITKEQEAELRVLLIEIAKEQWIGKQDQGENKRNVLNTIPSTTSLTHLLAPLSNLKNDYLCTTLIQTMSFLSFKKLLPLALFTVLLLSACSKKEKDPLEKYGVFVKTVMRTDTGAFRGFNFGDKMDSVLARETAKATEADENYLYFEHRIDTLGSFDIAYDFDENGLSEIQSFVYINNINKVDSVFNAFKTYFDDHFGKNETQMGYNVWSVKSADRGNININLSDESADFTADGTPGKISISIYPEKN
ncbi:MAG TPA: four helix bundle protein [Bacteroidia bacterium]|jgi:four helix bundle protein